MRLLLSHTLTNNLGCFVFVYFSTCVKYLSTVKVVSSTRKSETPLLLTTWESVIWLYLWYGTVPPHSLASHCKYHTSSKALGTLWVQSRCSTQLSQPPAPPAQPLSESCTHMKPTHRQMLCISITLFKTTKSQGIILHRFEMKKGKRRYSVTVKQRAI